MAQRPPPIPNKMHREHAANGRHAENGPTRVAAHTWDSPAYEVLVKHNLMRSDWRVDSYAELNVKAGNSTPLKNCLWRTASHLPPCWWLSCWLKTAEVPSGTVTKMEDGRGGFFFLGNSGPMQGVHLYWDLFYRLRSNVKINGTSAVSGEGLVVQNGDQWIVVVPQGYVGLAEDMGQPVLLPPGMHQWSSATMHFERCIDLTQPVIPLGPYTLLTVDKGYEAVTQNNGKQEVLAGGEVHLLTHRNHKFEKFITCKIQTDDLKRIEVMTGDNVLMHVDATVCWQIDDVKLCAEKAAETMHQHGSSGSGQTDNSIKTIVKLQSDVLKQAEASLSALIGKVNFSDTFAAATLVQTGVAPLPTVMGTAAASAEAGSASNAATAVSRKAEDENVGVLFNVDKLNDCVTHANFMTNRYGVEILSINIISAKPAHNELMQSLAKGAVAAAEAQQLEITAMGKSKAATIMAKGDADAEVTRAEGSRQAAKLLQEESVAVQLAYIASTGDAMAKAGSSLILGNDPSSMGSMLLANPEIFKKKGGW